MSYGVQSANAAELRLLERQHTHTDVLKAVSAARAAGFSNLGIDLIFGLPQQELIRWQTSVRRVLELGPDHISAYALSLERGTPFGRWVGRGSLPAPDPDLAADMYEWASDELEAAGYVQYEISNWSRPGRECRHNLQCWRGLPYLGLGAGAHGYASGYRYSNVLGIADYVDCLRPGGGPCQRALGDRVGQARVPSTGTPFPFSPAMIDHHRQSVDDDMGEFMIMGLRLTREGIAANDFGRRFGRDLRAVYAEQILRLVGLGLLEWSEATGSAAFTFTGKQGHQHSEALRLSKRGRQLGNRVFMDFIGSLESRWRSQPVQRPRIGAAASGVG
jgi:oxygen-independent coproporphyrinogen-3 oxidase